MQVFTFHCGFERSIGILSIEPLAGQLHQSNITGVIKADVLQGSKKGSKLGAGHAG
jgi:hypothetical protein